MLAGLFSHAVEPKVGFRTPTALYATGYSGAEVVLICYEHRGIPALVRGIPSVDRSAIPAVWPGDRFDVIWTFTLDRDSGRYVFGQVPQQLLGGDTDTVI
jgi:hypothetical protein